MKRILFIFSLLSCLGTSAQVITSPSGTLTVELQTKQKRLGWTVSRNGRPVYTVTDIALTVGTQTLGGQAAPKSVKQTSVSQTIRPTVPLKQSVIEDRYTEATMQFGTYSVVLRVMDNAVAYRFVTRLKGEVEVLDEQFTLLPADGFTAHIQPCGSFNTSYEEAYQHKSIAEWQKDGNLATVPALLSSADDTQLLIGESDVDDYPRLFLRTNERGITTAFPKAPQTWEPWGDRGEKITQEAAYIARTQGTRAFPWRFVVVADSKGIIEQTVPIQLARRCALTETDWIKPGKYSWEWWNGATPFGSDVDFKAGCNYETYCYFADFAAKYGIEYILLDEGWAKSTRDPFHGNDQLRLPDLIQYCNQKGVKIVLWLPWLTVWQNLDTIFKTYAEWGIPAVKIDFMDHADQWMVNFYKRVTAEAAKYRITVDWHGSFTPAGLEQEYPNLVSYEGVRGLEQMGGCRPENTTFLPFIRNAVGPADFTPGGMNNMQPDRYRADRPNSGTMGTRTFQMALYVVLESGVQMLADNPTRYYQNDDCTRYIASVPTTWDETRCLTAEAGQYVVVAKRKGEQWFIGGITNNEERTFSLPLSFLGDGQYRMTVFKDGANAGYQAMHYNRTEQTVDKTSVIEVKMAQNGGFAAVINSRPARAQLPMRYPETKKDVLTVNNRPLPAERLFRSEAVEKKIKEIASQLTNLRLAWMFVNCYPNTIDTTVHYTEKDADGLPDTFVYTGDIHAMWLRDSGAQVFPYVKLAPQDKQLQRMLAGVILRQLKCICLDPYANAFNKEPNPNGEWMSDLTKMNPMLHERKWEIDSLCYVLRLAYEYWRVTGDESVFGDLWIEAVTQILATFHDQQRKEGRGQYNFQRRTERQLDTMNNDGWGAPVNPVGLIASAFRPSDDATTLLFLVPSNFMAVTQLRHAAEILTQVNHREPLARQCRELADEVETALKKYAIHQHPKYGPIYAFEVDGFGNQILMDDANVPSLLAMAYLGDVPVSDPVYQNTRRFVWSEDNPYFFRGKAGEGIGGPHIGYDMPWPMSIMMKAFTSQDDAEIKRCIEMLMQTDAGTGFMHESFHKDDASNFTRAWFAWQNTLFGELIVKLVDEGKLDLLNSITL